MNHRLRLLTDEDFDNDIVRSLLQRLPDLDVVRVQDAGLTRAADPAILEWAAREGPILLTHDVTTMKTYAYDRVANGLPMPGVFSLACVLRQYPQYNCPAHHRDLGRDGRGGGCDLRKWEMVEAYLSILELGHYELKIAFEGLADENVWKRPAEGLLSVGELAGHIAYWEAMRLAGEGGEQPQPDLAKCQVSSPLIDHRFAYYPATIANPPSEQHLAMTAEQVCGELMRVHEEAVAHFKARNPDLESTPPGWPPGYTYGECLKYLAFHVGYHTGQIYSVRHLLGEKTPDN